MITQLRELGKFQLKLTNDDVAHVKLSPQLNYALGFPLDATILPDQVALYSCDLRGGISHICVYANGLTENMIMGDSLASLLRVVSVTGKPGDVVERVYNTPIFNKLICRELNEIEIEIRSLEGKLIEFDYGVVLITLCFKKAIYF